MQADTLHNTRPTLSEPRIVSNNATPPDPRPRHRVNLRRWSLFIGIGVLLIIWQTVTALKVYPAFIIPPPLDVARTFFDVLFDGTLLNHVGVTLSEMLTGLGIGAIIGVTLGYILAKSEICERILSPLIVGLQSTPVVAYAPLLVIWFGTGVTSKVVICTLIVFFPILMNTLVGVRGVPEGQREIMRLYAASRWQTFIKLEVPSALPVLLGGLKVSATLAVIGAVVGEFVGSAAGLGALIMMARSQFNTPLVFVAVLTLAVIARLVYGVIAWVESRALRWKPHD